MLKINVLVLVLHTPRLCAGACLHKNIYKNSLNGYLFQIYLNKIVKNFKQALKFPAIGRAECA